MGVRSLRIETAIGLCQELLRPDKCRAVLLPAVSIPDALKLAQEGAPRKPFYVTGQVGGKTFSVHAEGDRVIMTKEGEERKEVELTSPEVAELTAVAVEEAPGDAEPEPEIVTAQGKIEGGISEDGNEAPCAPGVSPLDEGLEKMASMTQDEKEDEDE